MRELSTNNQYITSEDSIICPHDRLLCYCAICPNGGWNLCPCGRNRGMCPNCFETRTIKHKLCPHDKKQYLCKICCGGGICRHGHERSTCKKCGGKSICIHAVIRRFCKKCVGSAICEHSRIRRYCRYCKRETCKKHTIDSVSYMKSNCPHCKQERSVRSKMKSNSEFNGEAGQEPSSAGPSSGHWYSEYRSAGQLSAGPSNEELNLFDTVLLDTDSEEPDLLNTGLFNTDDNLFNAEPKEPVLLNTGLFNTDDNLFNNW